MVSHIVTISSYLCNELTNLLVPFKLQELRHGINLIVVVQIKNGSNMFFIPLCTSRLSMGSSSDDMLSSLLLK
jgi:hypothetical protein